MFWLVEIYDIVKDIMFFLSIERVEVE